MNDFKTGFLLAAGATAFVALIFIGSRLLAKTRPTPTGASERGGCGCPPACGPAKAASTTRQTDLAEHAILAAGQQYKAEVEQLPSERAEPPRRPIITGFTVRHG